MSDLIYIAFTGHRDRRVNEDNLDALAREFPGAIWVHGGAIGFDRQVNEYAVKHHIQTWVILPDYDHFGLQAPLIRNQEIIKAGKFLVALWDGRQYGGTWFTIKKARELGKEVRVWLPVPKRE